MKSTPPLALEIDRALSACVIELSKPLQNFGITGTSYGKFFKNGKRLYLTNIPQWTELYFRQELYNDVDHSVFYTPSSQTKYILWSSVKKDKVFEAMDFMNICNGFSIYKSNADYSEYFGFGGDRNNQRIVNHCINHLDAFDDFITCFKQTLSPHLAAIDPNRLITPQNTSISVSQQKPYLIEPSKIEIFKKQIGFLSL